MITMFNEKPLSVGERIPGTTLTFVRPILRRRGEFRCDCGREISIDMSRIERYGRKSCGCSHHRKEKGEMKMPVNDELGKRMKENYEQVPKYRLMRRTPVIIRIDGKAFHSFTKGFQRPFDEVLGRAMTRTMEYLCENIQGCIFGYKQSDEISLVLSDYKKLNSEAWFDYEVQKMCSIAASMSTMAFNKFFKEEFMDWWNRTAFELRQGSDDWCVADKYLGAYANAYKKGAMFDARVFNIPKEEVVNCIYWRQLDAARNSVQMVGQANFSHRELQGKSCKVIQEMLYEQKGINWNDYPTEWKRGVCWTKEKGLDYEMPMLKGEDRKYLEDLVHYQEE